MLWAMIAWTFFPVVVGPRELHIVMCLQVSAVRDTSTWRMCTVASATARCAAVSDTLQAREIAVFVACDAAFTCTRRLTDIGASPALNMV